MASVVRDIAYHRNGVTGAPFYVAILDDAEEGVLVAMLDAEDVAKKKGNPRCFVLSLDSLKDGIIAFAANSYRGDAYYPVVRAAAKEHEAGTFTPTLDAVDATALIEAQLKDVFSAPRGRPSNLAERVRS